jgi:hypothetical protein
MSISDLATAPREVNVGELLDVLRPRVQHLTALSHDKGYCLLRSPFPLALFSAARRGEGACIFEKL